MRYLPRFAASLSLALAGCAADETTVPGAGTDGAGGTAAEDSSGGGDVGDDLDDAAGSGGAAEASSGGDDGEAPPQEPILARGVTVSEIYANQGVAVPLFRDGAWVPGTERNARLVKGRNTLIRALVQTDADFVPREIQGKLTIIAPDGTQETANQRVMIEGPSDPGNFDTNIWVLVPGELMVPQVQFQLELFETDASYASLPEPAISAYPSSPGFVGIETTEMVLRVTLVPVEHALGPECPEAAVIDEAAAQFLEEELFMQNPVERVELRVREPLQYTQSMNSFGNLLSTLASLRDTDGADPSEYYYGLVRPCDGGPDGVGGQAISIPSSPDRGNAWTRTAVGRWAPGIGSTANTFVHEIGHTQGRRHVACSGEEGGADPSYPYEAGDLGVYGFGVLNFTLYKPESSKDYMTYCGNTWVSDWTWRAVWPYIQEITSWGLGDAPQQTQPILVGLIEPDFDSESWFVTEGTVAGRDRSEETFELATAGNVRTLPSTRQSMGDGGAYNIVVPLGETQLTEATTVTRILGNQRRRVTNVRLGSTTLRMTGQ